MTSSKPLLSEPAKLLFDIPSIEIASTLRKLDLRIHRNADKRLFHITKLINRFYNLTMNENEVQCHLDNWDYLAPRFNDNIIGMTDTQITCKIKQYMLEFPNNHICSLLSCYLPEKTICCGKLLSAPRPFQDIRIFHFSESSSSGTLYYRKCGVCNIKYYYNYYENEDGDKFCIINDDTTIICLFSNIAYDVKLLHRLDNDILFKYCGFSNYTNAYNMYCEAAGIVNHKLMDRFHVERTWFLWRLCRFFGKDVKTKVPVEKDFDKEILSLQRDCLDLFIRRWSSKRHQSYCNEDCCKLLVLDGHQKATRRVCAYKIGTIPSEELGAIKVGCPHLPAYKNTYCSEHIGFKPPPEPSKERKLYNLRNPTQQLICRTLKSDNPNIPSHRSAGIVAAVYNCGYICAVDELYGSESLSQVYNFLVNIVKKFEVLPTVIAYDDACNLVRFIRNSTNRKQMCQDPPYPS
ncbi:unnamed protein product [Didymodactylos carnosus]|uniref:Uncharacterized protein n=1 Tax=Didymodactylos carnosus TaxID=1234261 RepID=A0A814ZV67_9BILA|nr:unnamed protein product [Didymodactylos carnosus]CAF1248784.1 unnamed protein product [Didymodactylos carnosus]CAF3894590.1 unnamed protein product [Didymodactylos carnosus]CAF4016829.1 unnamed protein product [Didymodactylos carnosus]